MAAGFPSSRVTARHCARHMDVVDAKASLRVVARNLRRASRVRAPATAPDLAADRFLDSIAVEPPCDVSGYWPIQGELDPRPLLTRLLQRGCRCALPVIVGRELPLLFREWRSGDALANGPFGTSEPGPEAAEIIPEILVVPLLAFDDRGYRLGYGGGYYDRTLRSLRRGAQKCVAVGLAYAGQEVETVPVSEMDERLDWVVHENFAKAYP